MKESEHRPGSDAAETDERERPSDNDLKQTVEASESAMAAAERKQDKAAWEAEALKRLLALATQEWRRIGTRSCPSSIRASKIPIRKQRMASISLGTIAASRIQESGCLTAATSKKHPPLSVGVFIPVVLLWDSLLQVHSLYRELVAGPRHPNGSPRPSAQASPSAPTSFTPQKSVGFP